MILGFRELATDLPQTYQGLGMSSVTAVATTTLLNWPLGTWYIVCTLVTPWGETLASNELPVTVTAAGQALQIQIGFPSDDTHITGVKVYLGSVSAGQNQYVLIPVSALLAQGIFLVPGGPFIPATPPNRNTAYLPDTDGMALGASAVFRWFNEGLRAAANFNGGGLPDFGAVGTISGQPLYSMNGWWKRVDNAWYDGYPLYLGRKNDVFRRSNVPGVVGTLGVFQASDRLICEVWPQPSRTSAQTALAYDMGATDPVAFVTSTAQFVLGFGLAMIGTEIVEFSGLGPSGQLLGLTRGLNGTIPSSQLAGTLVTELNLMISGFRVPSTYAVGSSMSTLNLPPGWEDALKDYLLYRYREAEQDRSSAKDLLQQFNDKMQTVRVNRIIAGPRQVQANAGRGAETMAGLGSPFGGVIVP